jgi:hypothetical protein
VRKLFAFLSVVAVVLAMSVSAALADGNGNGNGNGGGNGRCNNPNAAAHNPHCNGGKPGGHDYKGNGCPSFLRSLNMCSKPGNGNGNGNGHGNGNGGNSQSQSQQQSQTQSQRQCVLVVGLLQPANC